MKKACWGNAITRTKLSRAAAAESKQYYYSDSGGWCGLNACYRSCFNSETNYLGDQYLGATKVSSGAQKLQTSININQDS